MKLDRFYPIFDSADWLRRLLPSGIKTIQLRIKDRSNEEIRKEVETAKAVCLKHDALLILNDYWEIAIDSGCSFIHLGQEDLDDADVPAVRRRGIRLGVSTHSRDELDRALDFDPGYVALGPIYPTILKKMKWDAQGVAKLAEWKQLVGDRPLVAIGGMTVENCSGAFEAGADIVSAVTDITLNNSPEARVAQWVGATR